MHTGTVMVFPSRQVDPDGLDHDRAVALIEDAIDGVPRYRQRVRSVGTGLGMGLVGTPVWADDPDFDLTYHVRRVTLPEPSDAAQLETFLSRILTRTLPRDRPLWEAFLVDGLEGGRVALVVKTHQAMLDAAGGAELSHLLLTDRPRPRGARATPTDTWLPEPDPRLLDLAVREVWQVVSNPVQALARARRGGVDAGALGALGARGVRLARGAGHALGAVARTVTHLAPDSPLSASAGQVTGGRAVALLALPLDDLRAARRAPGRRSGRYTVHDVLLAAVTGALRGWMLSRGEPVTARSSVRVLVPVSLAGRGPMGGGGAAGMADGDVVASDGPGAVDPGTELLGTPVGRLQAVMLDLPVGESSARMRLQQVAHRVRREILTGQAVAADRIAELAGFGPARLHALAARAASAMSHRLFNLIIVNAPGPQHRLYAGTTPMLETYPLVPLVRGQALAIGMTSYDGTVYVALDADHQALPDLDLLAQLVRDEVTQLREDA